MKVCFVGIGSIAKRHIHNLMSVCKNQSIELSIDALRRKETKDTGLPESIKNVYTSIEELPRDYDIVFLTNPTEYHADMLIALHDHSRHFFIEKPVTSINTIEKLDDFPFRKNSVYYVACPLRYSGVIQYLKDNIDINTVNAVRSISSSYLPEWRPGTDYRQTYSAHAELGGGVDIDLIHEWDYLTYLFGMPSSVKHFTGKVSKLDIDSADYAVYIARFGTNMIGELHLDYFGRKNMRTVEIYTDEDTIIGDIIEGRISYLKTGKTIDLYEERDIRQTAEIESFLNSIKGEIPLQSDVMNAIRVLRLTQGII